MQKYFKEEEVIIPVRQANLYSFVLFFIAIVVFGAPYVVRSGIGAYLSAWKDFLSNYLLLFFSIAGGMFMHEWLHALTWALFCKQGIKSVKFGFSFRNLAPYVHCEEYLPLMPFCAGVLMPGIVLGVIPGILSSVMMTGWMMCFSTFFTAGAAGDFLSVLALRKYKASAVVLDHPHHLGFFVRTDFPE